MKRETIVVKRRDLEKTSSVDLLTIDFIPRELIMSRIRAGA